MSENETIEEKNNLKRNKNTNWKKKEKRRKQKERIRCENEELSWNDGGKIVGVCEGWRLAIKMAFERATVTAVF